MKISPQAKRVHLPEVVGKGYGTFWNFKGRYRVCKGSRASKKSKTTALNIIKRMMQYPEANTLVVRKVFRTLKDSCFTELKWAINRLGVQAYWEVKESPLEMTYIPTGQKIYFRGLDDPLKVTSITVEIGYLCWCWIEEAYEITNEDDFNMLDESIRGAIPEETGLFKQITLTFNPWNEKHWIRKRFFGEITATDGAGATVEPYLVRVTISDLYIRKGPGTNYGKNGFIKPGVYTIVAESNGTGASKWGKLKSGAGWISLDYAKPL